MSELKCFRCGGHCECGLVFCGGTEPFREPGPLCEPCWGLPQAELDAACDAFFKRASESQREGGFAVGQRVRVRSVSHESMMPLDMLGCLGTVRDLHPDLCDSEDDRIEVLCDDGGWYIHPKDLEPADPAPAQPVEMVCPDGVTRTMRPYEPPQPAPMTRAARVLSGMMADPYNEPREVKDMQRHKANLRNEAARLRMASMSLDRPLDAEQARWERLVCAVHPVTGRAVRR